MFVQGADSKVRGITCILNIYNPRPVRMVAKNL